MKEKKEKIQKEEAKEGDEKQEEKTCEETEEKNSSIEDVRQHWYEMSGVIERKRKLKTYLLLPRKSIVQVLW